MLVVFVALVATASASADAGVDPPPDAGEPSSDAGVLPPLSAEEAAKLAAELGADAPPPPPAIPDLSRVNVAAMIPGVASMNPDIAFIFDFDAAGFRGPPLQTGGHDPDHSGFTLRQVELAAGASVDPYARFDVDLVFKEGVEVEEAYITTLSLPFSLQARVGDMFTHLGRQNEKHPHAWSFVDQPLVYGKFLGEDGQHLKGAELSWLSPLPWSVTLYGMVAEAGEPATSVSYSPTEDALAFVNNPLDLVYLGVVEQFIPVGDDFAILWGLSTEAGPAQYLGEGGRAELQATDLLLRYKPADSESRWSVELQLEALLRTRHQSDELLIDEGGYAQLLWRLNPEWETGVRYEIVNGIDDDTDDPSGIGPLVQRGAAQVTFYPSHFSRLRFQASVADRHDGSPPTIAGFLDFEVLIGAHGSHSY
jgi:hypothetical protein